MNMNASAPAFQRLPFLLLAVCAVLLGSVCVAWSFPCPLVDDAFYKSPAAELAQHGRLAIPCSVGFLPRMNEIFACYPPLYQLILAAWYALFGVSLQSSLAFSFCVHAANSFLIVEVSRRIVRDDQGPAIQQSWCLPWMAGIVHLCNLAYFDRQEELALVFVFFQVLLTWHDSPRSRVVRSILLGVLVGCAALTSPWVGLLALLHVLIREVLCLYLSPNSFRHRCVTLLSRLALVAIVVGLLICAWLFTIEHHFPGTIRDQFIGILRHLGATQKSMGLSQRFSAFYESCSYSRGQLLVTAIVFGGMWGNLFRERVTSNSQNVLGLFGVAVMGLGLLIYKRPEAYTYFGAIQILSLPCSVFVFRRFFIEVVRERTVESRLSLLGRAAMIGCVTLAVRDTATHAYFAMRLPVEERAEQVFARLQRRIPENARVAASSRHWLAFQGRNVWRESFFSSLESPTEVLSCDWLVMEPERGNPYFLEHFELVEAVPPSTPACHTYAYSLYRRRGNLTLGSPEGDASDAGPGLKLTRGSTGR